MAGISAQKASHNSTPAADGVRPWDDILFRLHCLSRNSTNLSMLKYRDYQGFLVTGQHSGTHWVKWMLSNALAHHYGVAPPRFFNNASSNDLIGHPKHPRLHPQLPRIASTHSIPAYALQWGWVRGLLPLPPYALLVRDMRDVLISNYEKWRHKYNTSFSNYLAGDPQAKTYVTDPWNYTHFLNRWGDLASRYPQETLVLRYEDFRRDKVQSLERISKHFRLPLTAADLEAGAAAGSKEIMAQHQDPSVDERPIRPDGEGDTRFSDEDMALLRRILERNLRHDFGYDYLDRPRGFQTPGGARLSYTPSV
ncbi:MAG: sulfotransferase domain-containing protein [Alphaproteobacteria bacterium]